MDLTRKIFEASDLENNKKKIHDIAENKQLNAGILKATN